MAIVFWDSVGVILVDFMSKRATIILDVYINTLKKLKARMRRVRPALEISKVLLQHGKARPHPASNPMRSSAPLAGQQFHILYICQTWHDLTSICFGPSKKVPQKKSLRGRHFSSDKEVKTAVRNWLKMQPVEFYNEGICAFVKRWESGLESGRLYREVTTKCSCYILSCDARFVYL